MSKWKHAALAAWWLLYIAVLGPFLLSHDSYELPIFGGLLGLAGLYLTIRTVRNSQ